ncbi:hypothetical protein UL76_24540, partial [Shigella dysenteriae]
QSGLSSLKVIYYSAQLFSSEEFLFDNSLEKDENSSDNCFEVEKYNAYEAYNSENLYFTREEYTYDYDLLNAI